VSGTKILDQEGRITTLSGPSFFWTNTAFNNFRFYNAENVAYFADVWNASVVRAAVGAQFEGSILEEPEVNLARAVTLIDAAIEEGLYVIVDWHSHQAEMNEAEAIDFFTEIATLYGDTPNVIYEIYNEPETTRPYAERVIDAIREIDPDNLIIVGTPNFSIQIAPVVQDPIAGESNILYAFHFYAASHGDAERASARAAIDAGLPLFISEFGTVTFTGDGLIDRFSTNEWIALMEENDLSFAIWSVSDTFDSSSFLITNVPSAGPYTDAQLTEAGELAMELVSTFESDNAGEIPQ